MSLCATVPRRMQCWLLVALAVIARLSTSAQTLSNWRIFSTTEGLKDAHAAALTHSPRGNVWIKHDDLPEISVMDGYTVRTIPAAGRDSFRVYEGRSGQLWTLYSQGLALYDGSAWIRHPVSDIRIENENDPLRQIRPIPLIPAEHGRVLFLLSERLMDFDLTQRRASTILRVSETGLEKFLEMSEARDGGVWITGTRGLLKLVGTSSRQIQPGVPRVEHRIPPEVEAENPQRPFEDERGFLTMAAASSKSQNLRVILQFNGTNWLSRPVRGENLRQAWSAWDGTLWGFSFKSIYRFETMPEFRWSRESVWAGQFKDVTTDTNGGFWLATTEGIVRYAPFSWRPPPMPFAVDSPVHAMGQEVNGTLWFACNDFLFSERDGEWRRYPWPGGFEPNFEATDSLYPLREDRLVISAHDRTFQFDPQTARFQELRTPEGRRVRVLGQLKDGSLGVEVFPAIGGSAAGFPEMARTDGRDFQPWLKAHEAKEAPSDLTFVYAAQNGDVWIGGTGGVAVYRNGALRTYSTRGTFPLERALCAIETGDGKIWCGGTDSIVEFNGRSWTRVRSGLDHVNSMMRARDGRLWIATARGLYSHARGSWVSHGGEEGLPSPAVAKTFEDGAGQIWAGTTRGLAAYHPEADSSPPRTMPPVIQGSGSQVLSEDAVSFVFNAVDKWDFTRPERLLFSYQLDEGPWSAYTNVMTAAYESLRPGRHRLQVRAMDRNWNEDPTGAQIEFSVVTPWHKDRRFLSISIAGLALVVFFAGLAVNRHLRLKRSYAEVERIVAIRTGELERVNQQLLHSQKMTALGTMAAGIAHDFNNILSIIKGSVQIIENHPEDREKIRLRVSRIKTMVDQGTGIVRSMLGFSRISEKDLALCDVSSLAAETIRLLADRFTDEVVIRFDPAPELPKALIVRELVQQILLNIILNAAEAITHPGEIGIHAFTATATPEGMALPPSASPKYVCISVRDNGSGIAPEVLPRIFEPFFTTKALSSRRGTGLGLSMVYQLAREMGYGLGVISKVGQGSTFTLYIPLKSNP